MIASLAGEICDAGPAASSSGTPAAWQPSQPSAMQAPAAASRHAHDVVAQASFCSTAGSDALVLVPLEPSQDSSSSGTSVADGDAGKLRLVLR